jgi:hypothetical protein
MITTRLDPEMIALAQFTHPEHGLVRIIGDYNGNPAVHDSKEPYYKCQQVEPPKNYIMLSKAAYRDIVNKTK